MRQIIYSLLLLSAWCSYAQLPYYQDFENVKDSIYDDNTNNIVDLPQFSYSHEANSNGSLEIRTFRDFSGQLMVLSRVVNSGGVGSNEAILELDLSGETTADDILISFDYSSINPANSDGNRIMVRGSDSDPWLELFHWGEAFQSKSAFSKEKVIGLNISQVLIDGMQNYSSTFQIAFREDGSNHLPNSGLILDNLEIFKRFDDDLLMLIVDAPAARADFDDMETLDVDILNIGEMSASNFPVRLEIEGPTGITTVNETISGPLASLDTLTYTFTNLDLSDVGTYQFKAFLRYTADDNLRNDTLVNRTFKLDQFTGDLPYFEDFASYPDTLISTNIGRLPTTDGISFLSTDLFSSLSVGTNGFTDDQFVQLGRSQSNSIGARNDLILTIDLSDFSANTDGLLLTSNLSKSGSTNPRNNIFVRGDEDQEWLVLFDWGTDLTNFNTFAEVTLNISDTLVANGQSLSTHTQIRYGEGSSLTVNNLKIDDIRVWKKPEFDVRPVSLETPEDKLIYVANEPITVGLLNYGEETVSNVPLTLILTDPDGTETVIQETASGTFNQDDTTFHTFNVLNFDVSGPYEVTAIARLANDEDQTNDTIRAVTNRLAHYMDDLPYIQGFESASQQIYTDYAPNIDGVPGFHLLSDDRGRLEIDLVDRRSGFRSLALSRRFTSSTVNNNELILTLDLSAYDPANDDLLLDFSLLRSTGFTDNLDGNKVFIRSNPGDSWIPFFDWLDNYSGNDWVDFRHLSISDTLVANSADYSSHFQIRFAEEAASGNVPSVNLDDIRVFRRPDQDLQVTAIENLTQGFTDQEKFELEVTNFGAMDVVTPELAIQITHADTTYLIEETITNTLSQGDTITYTFSHDFDFTLPGDFEISGIAQLPTDDDQSNDTLSIEFRSIDVYRDELPYSEDFESLDADLSLSFDQPTIGLSGLSFISRIIIAGGGSTIHPASGTVKAYSALDGQGIVTRSSSASTAQWSDLILTMDLSNYAVASDELLLDFRFNQSIAFTEDSSRVFIRGSITEPWLELYDLVANSNDSPDWSNVTRLSISDLLTNNNQEFSQSFQIRFGNAEEGRELRLDDIMVYRQPETDIALLAVDGPDLGVVSDESITLTFTSLGLNSIDEVPFELEVSGPDGTQSLSQTYSESTLNSLDTATFEIDGIDLSSPGEYELLVYATVDGDLNQLNDTLRYELLGVDQFIPAGVFYESFEDLPDSAFEEIAFEIPGLEGFSMLSQLIDASADTLQNTTEASFGRHDLLSTDGDYSLRFGGTDTESRVKHNLILTLDLSDRSVDNDTLYLDFDGYLNSNTRYSFLSDNNVNAVYIRGNNQEEWQLLYNWYEVISGETWNEFHDIEITQALIDANMEFSATTQLAFTYHNFLTEDFYLDNLRIYSSFGGLSGSSAFTIDDRHFIALGEGPDGINDLIYEYDLDNELYTIHSQFPGAARTEGISFVLDDKVYLGLGRNESFEAFADLYVFDSLENNWTALNDFPGGARYDAVSFVVNNTAYIATGRLSSGATNDLWAYDPDLDEWTQAASTNTDPRQAAFTFVIDDKAYLGGGFYVEDFGTTQLSDLQEYDPATDTWTEKIFADGINLSVNDANAYALLGRGYIAYGGKDDLVEYDPITNEIVNFGDELDFGDIRRDPIVLIPSENAAYIGLGSSGIFDVEYHPEIKPFVIDNFPPTLIELSNTEQAENISDVTIGSFSTGDGSENDTHTYSLTTGDGTNDADNDRFEINGASLSITEAFDFEEQNEYFIYVRSTDSGGRFIEQDFTITVTDNNDSPVVEGALSFSIDENAQEGDVVGLIPSSDQDGDALTYTITSGNTDDIFGLDDNQIVIADASALNFESDNNYGLNLAVTDGSSQVTTFADINIIDINEAPEFETNSLTVQENPNQDQVVGTIEVSDPEGEIITVTLVSGNDDNVFTFNSDSRRLQINDPNAFNFEAEVTSFALQFEASDGTLTSEHQVTVIVSNVNEAPTLTDATFELEENPQSRTFLGNVGATDPENDVLTYYLTNAAANAFSIDEAGDLYLENPDNLDPSLATRNSGVLTYELAVEVSDGSLSGNAIISVNQSLVLSLNGIGVDAKVFPNPTTDYITIKSNHNISGYEIYDLTGKLHATGKTSTRIKVSELKKGAYILSIFIGENKREVKFFKQ